MSGLVRQVIDMGNGRTKIRYISPEPRQPSKHADFPIPMMIRSFSDPVQSMADGKWYDNPSDLRKSYKAENNPAGVDYIELGNEDFTPDDTPVQTRDELKDEIRQAINMVDQGWNPQSVPLDDI